MATSDLLNKLRTDITDTYTSINNLGGTIPEHKNTENISPAIESIYNKLPKVSDTGTDLSLSPTLEARLGLIPRGNTFQQTYSGKNLFNSAVLSDLSADGVTVTWNDDGTVKLNGTYTGSSAVAVNHDMSPTINTNGIMSIAVISGSMTGEIRFNLFDSNSSWYNRWVSLDNTNNRQLTNTYTFNKCNIAFYPNATFNNLIIGLQVENGSTATSYEPYTGGQPSPNPSYPQMPKVVTGENNVKISNKNHFTSEMEQNAWSNGNGTGTVYSGQYVRTKDFIEVDSNTEYTLDFVFTNGSQKSGNILSYDENKNFISSTTFSETDSTFTTSSTTRYLKFNFYSQSAYGTITPDSIENIILVKGATVVGYVEHKEQNYPINLGNIELVEIGDYADYIEGTPDNWVKKEAIGKVVLDGSENWRKSSNTSVDRFILDLSGIPNRIVGYVNYFIIEAGNTKAGTLYTNANQIVVNFSEYGTTTLENFKTWLSTHNTIIWYLLAEPTDVPITDTTLINQLNALYYARSYDDETNISTSCEEGNMPMKINASALKGASND